MSARGGLAGRERLPDDLSVAVADRREHGVDVAGLGNQEESRAREGHRRSQAVDERLWLGVELARLAHLRPEHGAEHHPGRQARWAREDADHRAAGEALDGPALRHVERLVDVDVVAGERAAQDQVVVVVVLDQTDLASPRRADVTRGGERPGGRADAREAHEREVHVQALAPSIRSALSASVSATSTS